MPPSKQKAYKVHVDQLQPGVFISLDLSWFQHPFLFRKFKISSESQIEALREMGVTQVICLPSKSDAPPKSAPKAPAEHEEIAAAQPEKGGVEAQQLWQLKRQRMEQLQQLKHEIARCEQKYRKTIQSVPNLMSEVFAGSEEAVGEAEAMVEEMVEIFLSKAEVLMHLMDQPQGKEGFPYHVLNVTVLSLSLGREAGLGEAQLQDLGLAALFHDIGKMRIEKKLLKKKPPLSQGELEIMQAHPRHGVEIAAKTKRFSHEALKGIWQHHERRDGSGYPKGLRGSDIGLPARIIRIVDLFDNFCNRIDPRDSLPPNWALNRMYTRYEDILDHSLLSSFIKRIGIFPPGTVVRLSNESLGMVVSVNPNHVLRPYLLLYDPEIPKKEAIIFSLEDEPQLTITGTLHPGELSEEVHRYLSPRPRVSYYMEPSEGGP